MHDIIINTETSLTGDSAKDFFDFLTEQKNLGISYFKKNNKITFKENTICLQQDVVCANLEPDGSYHLNFIGPMLGDGGLATVYAIDKTIKVTHVNFVEFGYTKPQVVKVQLHCSCNDAVEDESCTKHNPKQALQNEIHLSRKVPHLECQLPVIHLEKTSYMIMNRLPGKELLTIIQQNQSKVSILSLQQRMDLSLTILIALKTQVTDQNIIHHDIKPENILVDLEAPISVGIIDYGFGVEIPNGTIEVYNSQHGGTLTFVAPEVIASTSTTEGDYLQTPALDLFSAARVLIVLWGGLDISYTYTNATDYWEYLLTRNFRQLTELFNDTDIPKIDYDTLKKFELDSKIRDCLKRMLSFAPEKRGNIDTAISTFGAIRDDFTQKISPSITSVPSTLVSATKQQPKSAHNLIKRAHSYTEGSTSPKMLFFPSQSKIDPRKLLSTVPEEHETDFSAKRRQITNASMLSTI